MKTLIKNLSLCLIALTATTSVSSQELNKKLLSYLQESEQKATNIEDSRKKELADLANYIVEDLQKKEEVKILAICTHNSRRSHMTQLLIETAATYYGINTSAASYGVNRISAFSGGTEATAFNQNAINALESIGFSFTKEEGGSNPKYIVNNGTNKFHSFSKKYSNKINPSSNFIAVMVCSDADKSCPVVDGADARFAIPYDDPRYYDKTPSQDAKYAETVEKIATEMMYVMSNVKKQLNILEEGKK